MPNPSDFYNIYWVLGLPLLGFLIQAFAGKSTVQALGPVLGKRVMGGIATLMIGASFAVGLVLTLHLAQVPAENRMVVVPGPEWISLLSARVPFEWVVDPLSMTMVLIITGIGSLIHLYSTGYMAEEKDYTRFFTYLNLFIASMLTLVLGNNLVLLFIGWEGVGLCSYLLIGFWYKDVANSKAANKAFIVNRIGDWGLTLGIFLIFALLAGNYDKTHFADGRFLSYDLMIPALADMLKHQPALATAIGLLLFVGACGKSAQFPLYLWLPDAMAGPTPVSALIHAATMVTSGVVLLNRMHIVFEYSPVASAVVIGVGTFTALFAALVAFGQSDIKKVLAYSTVSQLGFMFIGCGAGAYWAGMFHVTTHAFFKALLFLGSGAVIHAMAHNQDMRNYGNLRKYLPITAITMVIGYIAIAGLSIPGVFGFAGFYSKEALLGSALAMDQANAQGIHFSQIAGWTGLFVALLTALYMTRMTFLTFFGGEERWRAIPATAHHENIHDSHEAHAVATEDNAVSEPVVTSVGHAAQASLSEAADEEAAHGANHGMEEHGHGPDVHGFFYTHDELHAREHADHEHEHHELDKNHTPHEVPLSMWIPLAVLAVASVFGGYVLERNETFQTWLEPSSGPTLFKAVSHPEGLPVDLGLLSFIAATLGVLIGAVIYWKGLPKKEGWDESKWNPFRRAAGAQFGYDRAMVSSAVEGGAVIGTATWKYVDGGFIDGIVNGVAVLAVAIGTGFRKVQSGFVRTYALLMLIGAIALLGYFTFARSLKTDEPPPTPILHSGVAPIGTVGGDR